MKTVTLTPEQAARYDSDDESVTAALMAELRREYGRIATGEPAETEVRHPSGYVVSAHTAAPPVGDAKKEMTMIEQSQIEQSQNKDYVWLEWQDDPVPYGGLRSNKNTVPHGNLKFTLIFLWMIGLLLLSECFWGPITASSYGP